MGTYDRLQAKPVIRGEVTMTPLARDFLMLGVVGTIFALSAAVHSPYAEALVAWCF
jgi:hypothetical protein